MTTRWVVLVRPDGMFGGRTQVELGKTAAEEGTNPNGWIEIDTDAEIGHEGKYDFATGIWSVDGAAAAAAIDRAYLVENGVTAIDLAHRIKELEARIILAGLAIDGRLAREAEATGKTVDELANTVVTNADAEADAELARIVAKADARAG